MGIVGIEILFLLEIQASFFLHIPNFKIFRFQKKIKKKLNSDLKVSQKNVQVVSLYTYFQRVFLIKRAKKECEYVIMLKIALLLVKIYVLVDKKGRSGLLRQVAAKPFAYNSNSVLHVKIQKQSFADVLKNRFSQIIHKFYRKATVLELLFNKVAGLQHRCCPVKFVEFLRTPLLQNISGEFS